MWLTRRESLSFRGTLVGFCFAGFLLLVAAAVAASGLLLHALALWLPLVLLAGLESTAIVLHLADRIFTVHDVSPLAGKGAWPPHLLSDARFRRQDAISLYVPWQGDGIAINALGLRTAMPQRKRPDEWRVAVTGGSTVWGWRVRDADTIPA